MSRRCKSPSKRKYASPVDAMLALQRIWDQRGMEGSDKHERCWYPCGDHYHLTSWRTETGP